MKHKNFDYDVAGKDLRDLFNNIMDGKSYNNGIKYTGVEIESPSVLATSLLIREAFEQDSLDYDKQQGRDPIDVFINKVFQLGYSVGYEKSKEQYEPFMNIVTKQLKDFSNNLEQIQKDNESNSNS